MEFQYEINDFVATDLNFPTPTKWEHICHCCGFQLNYVPAYKRYYLNHWKISFLFPILVTFIILSSFYVFLFGQYFYLHIFSPMILTTLTIFMLLFIISYFSTILTGPGYLPYYYPHVYAANQIDDPNQPLMNKNQKDFLSGLVSTPEQFKYATSQTFPIRTHYFRCVHRVVLKPDHFCLWTSSFIGKKNMKLFFLFNFWGTLYNGSFFLTSVASVRKMAGFDSDHFTIWFVINIIYAILALCFFLFTGTFLLGNSFEISRNITEFEKRRKEKRPEFTCLQSWEDVFGSYRKWYLWPFPFPPFYGIDDYSLALSLSSKKL